MEPLTIIAIIAGVVVFLVVFTIILLFWRKRKAETSSDIPFANEDAKFFEKVSAIN